MVASRTPQPAIEIGIIVISMTGGIEQEDLAEADRRGDRLHDAPGDDDGEHVNERATGSRRSVRASRLKITRLAITAQAWM